MLGTQKGPERSRTGSSNIKESLERIRQIEKGVALQDMAIKERRQ